MLPSRTLGFVLFLLLIPTPLLAQAEVVFLVGEDDQGQRAERLAITSSAASTAPGTLSATALLSVLSGSIPTVSVLIENGADPTTTATALVPLLGGSGQQSMASQFGDLRISLLDAGGAAISPRLDFTLAVNAPLRAALPGPTILANHLVAEATADPGLLNLLAPHGLLSLALPHLFGGWGSTLPNGRAEGYNGAVGPIVRYFAFDTASGGLAEVVVLLNVSNALHDTSLRMANAVTSTAGGSLSSAAMALNSMSYVGGAFIGLQGSTTLFPLRNTALADALSPITIPDGADITMVTAFLPHFLACVDPTTEPWDQSQFAHSINYGTSTTVTQASGLRILDGARFTPVAYPAWSGGCRMALGLVRAQQASGVLRFSTSSTEVLWAGSPRTYSRSSNAISTPVLSGAGAALTQTLNFGTLASSTLSSWAAYPALHLSVLATAIL